MSEKARGTVSVSSSAILQQPVPPSVVPLVLPSNSIPESSGLDAFVCPQFNPNPQPNREQIGRFFDLTHRTGVRETRTTGFIVSGYCIDRQKYIDAVAKASLRPNVISVFDSLNNLKPHVVARSENTLKPVKTGEAVSAKDVLSYSDLLFDIDVERSHGVSESSSSNDELLSAKNVAQAAKEYLVDLFGVKPMVLMSGNGFALRFVIDLPATPESTKLVTACLISINEKFGSKAVKIDLKVHDLPRITKIAGVPVRKGDNTLERPWRVSQLLEDGDQIIIPRKKLIQLAGSLYKSTAPVIEKSHPHDGHDWTEEEMEAVLDAYGIEHGDSLDFTGDHGDGKKWQIDCVHNPEHQSPDSYVNLFVGEDGKKHPYWHCSHDSCTEFLGWYKFKKFMKEHHPEVEADWRDKPEKKARLTQRMSVADLRAERDANKAAAEVVSGLVYRNTVNINVGDSSLGKTPFMFQMGLCVAHGLPFIGQETTRGRVLIVDYENYGDALDFIESLATFLKLGDIDSEWFSYIRNLSFEDLEWEIEDYRPSLVIIDSLRGFNPKAEKDNPRAVELITQCQRIAQTYNCSFELIHHPRKDDRSLKAEDRPDLFNSNVPAMKWLQEASGAHALVQQTHTRLGFEKPKDKKGADLGVRGYVKSKGEVGIWLLHREINDFGLPIGYRRVTGVDLLSTQDRATLELLPFDKPMGFTEILKFIWDDPTIAAKQRPYLSEFLRRAPDAGVLLVTGAKGTPTRKYTRLKECK